MAFGRHEQQAQSTAFVLLYMPVLRPYQIKAEAWSGVASSIKILFYQLSVTQHTSDYLDLSFNPAKITQRKSDFEEARQDQRTDEINIS